MNLDSLSFALSEISYCVANLTKKNFKASAQELSKLVAQHGPEAERHLLRCLFSYVDFSGDGKSSGKDYHQTQYLVQECNSLISKPNFVSILCYAIDNPLHRQKTLKISAHLLTQISRVLKLTKVQEVAFGLALIQSSNSELGQHASAFVRQKFPELLRLYTDTETSADRDSGLQDSSPEVIHFLLTHLQDSSKDQIVIPSEQKEAFLEALKKDFPLRRVPIVVAPLLYKDQEDIPLEKVVTSTPVMSKHPESSLVDLIREIGYGLTASFEECLNNLNHMGFREATPGLVAKIICLMARTHVGLHDSVPLQILNSNNSVWNDSKDKSDNGQTNSWNIDIFIHVIHELSPLLSWKDVVQELDHPGMQIKDRNGLKLLWTALKLGLAGKVFPMEHMYRKWSNAEGQLSFFQQVLKNSDLICLMDYPCHMVAIDVLKAPPEDDGRDVSNWKSLDLIEVLLQLSDSGQYSHVQDLFKFPIQHCPDMLVLALLQITSSMNVLRQDLLTQLIPAFLVNHPNSAIVLQYAWHCQQHAGTVKPVLMHSMADWYMRGECDQTRLSRILDVAQDLKALSVLLSNSPFPFVIDLACLASRREYLKLDKWLTDKIREHGESFIQACVNFLKRRCPQIILGGIIKEENLPKNAQLPPETLATLLACLQSCAGNVSQELSETILTMVGNCNILLSKPRQPPPGVVKTSRGLEPAFSAASITTPSNPLDALSNLGGSVTSLGSLGGSVNTPPISNVSQVFPMGGNLNSFPMPTPSSPAKVFPNPTPPVASSTSVINPNAFSAVTSQIPGVQFSSQLGLNTSTVMTPSINTSLGSSKNFFGPQGVDRLRQGLSLRNTIYPPTGEFGDMSQIFPDMIQPVAKEIEDEANSYFQRIYNHPPHPTLSIDEVLEMLKKYQESAQKREREVFNCMVRNLFEEYKFFPQYPDKELLITAQLFGGIIEQRLVTYMALGLALRCVLDALRKPHSSKMYYFGITALDRFKTRLKDYPQYCQHLASIPHFHEFPPRLIEFIEYGTRSQEPPTRIQGSTLPQGSITPISTSSFSPVMTTVAKAVATTTMATSTVTTTIAKSTTVGGKPSIANATNIDTLLVATEKDDKIVVPPEVVQDKMAFIVNNLSQVNLAQKTEEFREIVKDDYWAWAAQYLVLKRASIEPNFHTLYSNFLDTLKICELTKLVIKETFRNIKVLLRSDKGIANFSDRSLLKNLGHWLGMLTLAKSKPILQVDIDIKALLVEAYYKGQQELLYVVPFIAKVLESCSKSKVFKPPNPWTIGIMNVLAEMHQESSLKLNLKFEIEVLCKTLSIDINDLKPGSVLKDPEKLLRLDLQLSPLPKQQPEPVVPARGGWQTEQVIHPDPIQSIGPPPLVSSVTSGLIHAEESLGLVGTRLGGSTTPTSMMSVATPVPTGMPQPQFAYHEINVMSMGGLAQHIQVSSQLGLFQAHPQMKKFVRPAIEHAVQEWIAPVVDRSIKIAMTTCEQIVKKDFALDPEESRMRLAAHHMIRSLTAGMTLITCRDPLLLSINSNLKASFVAALRGTTQQQKDIIEQAASIVAQENVELACCFVQKTAVEKGLAEVDKRLATEFELRKHARSEGRRYCDPVVLTYQAERMPEQIRLKVGGVTSNQTAVYEEFSRNIPGFLPSSEREPHNAFSNKPLSMMHTYTLDEITQIYDKVIGELEHYIHSVMNSAGNPQVSALHSLLEAVIVARNARDVVSALALVQKAVEGLLEGLSQLSSDHEVTLRFRDGHLLVLKALANPRAYGHTWVCKNVTRCLIECREDFRYNLDALDCLIRVHLVNMQTYDLHLAKSMENGLNYIAVAFAMQVVRTYIIEERQNNFVTETDLYNTLETLIRISGHPRQPPEGLTQLIEMLRSNGDPSFIDRSIGGPISMMHSGISQAREFDDPPGLHDKTEFLLREWVNMYHSSTSGRDTTKAFTIFVHQMNLQGILKTDDLITRFFRLSTEMCIDLCYRAIEEQGNSHLTMTQNKCFVTLDAYVRLIALLVKHSGDATNTQTKVNLLNKVLGIVTGVLLQDHEVRNSDFQQLPYHRIFIMLFLELSAAEPVLDGISFQTLTAFCNTFHILRPTKAPGFAYAWVELVSHRVFLGRILVGNPQPKAWSMYAQLLIDLFKILAPFLRNVELPKPIQLLYKGTLRVLLVLLHDFPEFLCDYHYGFCDVIPPNCIQMRNLILSAFPRNMRLPDPFTPNLKVDMLPEIMQAPRVLTNFASMIHPPTFKKDLDSYIHTRSPVTFLSELRSNLQVSNQPGMRYNIPLINALVLYVGTQAISYIQSKGLTPSMSTITHSSHMDIFQNLAVDLDTEGRYLFLNAIANQLRFPNSHTHYFSCTLLYLFAETNTEAIQEQITRVLLERLIVNRPHPWGLLVTFIELIKNPAFKFWNHEFVRCAPEIEKLFESVARSCMQQKPPTETV